MSTPAGLLRVILKRGNDKTFVDIDASAVKAGTLAELGESCRKAIEKAAVAVEKAVESGAFGPPPKKAKAEKPTPPPE